MKNVNAVLDKMNKPRQELQRLLTMLSTDDFSQNNMQREAVCRQQEELAKWDERTKHNLRVVFNISKGK